VRTRVSLLHADGDSIYLIQDLRAQCTSRGGRGGGGGGGGAKIHLYQLCMWMSPEFIRMTYGRNLTCCQTHFAFSKKSAQTQMQHLLDLGLRMLSRK
jgi:hypothetical protein